MELVWDFALMRDELGHAHTLINADRDDGSLSLLAAQRGDALRK